jgi:ribose transport system substrate-binding protein
MLAGAAVGGIDLAAAAGPDPSVFNGPTEPAKAPPGIKVGIVSCAASIKGCQVQADAAAEAAQLVGWEVNMFDGKANPKTQGAAILDALAWGADVIIASSIDYRTIQLPLKEAEKAGVPVVALGQGGDTPNPLPVLKEGELAWTFAVDVDNYALGTTIGEWIIEDSGGKANIIVYTDREFDSVMTQHQGVLDALAKCEGCTVATDEFTASQIATTLGRQVVGYLRAHPDVDYIYAPFDPSAFVMVAAIRQAGLGDRVRLASLLGNEENIDLIRKGDVQVATMAFDTAYSGYAAIDQVIRYLNKQPLFDPHGENVPYMVLDETNLPESGNWRSDSGYKEKFEALWK